MNVNEIIACIIVAINAYGIIIIKEHTDWVDDVFLAISLAASTNFSLSMSFISMTFISIENKMKLVKEAMKYTQLESEPELELDNDPTDWPKQGTITFDDVSMKYKGTTRLALNGLSFHIDDKSKVGIKGRTGSGKSSVINTLFRLYPLRDGSIIIDGKDIDDIGLHWLRRNISYIPQNPFLLTGTVRENLDAHGQYSIDAIIQALKDVQLYPYVMTLIKGIDTELTQSNMVFSAGQKQLICLARAILEQNKILALDEATANIDYETDKIIQEIIRTKFKECTVVTVAHRLSTIADCDKIITVVNGKIEK